MSQFVFIRFVRAAQRAFKLNEWRRVEIRILCPGERSAPPCLLRRTTHRCCYGTPPLGTFTPWIGKSRRFRHIEGNNRAPSLLNTEATGLFHRIRAFCKLFGVITLRANQAGERATKILVKFQRPDEPLKIVSRTPAELGSGTSVDVHTADARKHPPSAAGVLDLVLGDILTHNAGRVIS